MDLRDPTKNQHFLPQVEQRLNAINPQTKSENQKIYSFSVKDRDAGIVSINSEKGVRISNNLSLHDLFSFDVLGKEANRYNFEKLFHSYEATIKSNIESLLSKINSPEADIRPEIINIFRFKILNFVRNPYSIEKILATFSAFKDIFPTDSIHYENFNRVLNGIKPQQKYLCKQLDITEDEYKEWLATIFLLLTPMKEGQLNFLDQFIKKIYENLNLFTQINIYTYNDETCLLSDRGYNEYEINGDNMVWEFNLCSYGFIRYAFVNIDAFIPENISKEIVDFYKSKPKSISIMKMHNDLTQLKYYNQRTVELCHEHVFGSRKEYKGVTISS